MFDQYDWHPVTGVELEPYRKPIMDSANVERAHLPFYTTIAIVRMHVADKSKKIKTNWLLAKDDRLFLLDGTSAPIHEANEADKIAITKDTVLDYLRFFCFFVAGDEGPFLIVEDINCTELDDLKRDDATRKEIEKAIRPAQIERTTDDGKFEASALVLYGNVLYLAQFSIERTGMIEMIDDNQIAPAPPVTNVDTSTASEDEGH